MHTFEEVSVEKMGWRNWRVVATVKSINGIKKYYSLAPYKRKQEALDAAQKFIKERRRR